jgi:hypothetical protein
MAMELYHGAGRVPSSDLPVVRSGIVQEPEDAPSGQSRFLQPQLYGMAQSVGQQPIGQLFQPMSGISGNGVNGGQRMSVFNNPPGGYASYEAALAAQQQRQHAIESASPWAQPQYIGVGQAGFPQDPNAYQLNHQVHGGMGAGGGIRDGSPLETVLSRMPDLGIGSNQEWCVLFLTLSSHMDMCVFSLKTQMSRFPQGD